MLPHPPTTIATPDNKAFLSGESWKGNQTHLPKQTPYCRGAKSNTNTHSRFKAAFCWHAKNESSLILMWIDYGNICSNWQPKDCDKCLGLFLSIMNACLISNYIKHWKETCLCFPTVWEIQKSLDKRPLTACLHMLWGNKEDNECVLFIKRQKGNTLNTEFNHKLRQTLA
jgi:hypothetical protein